jgi:F0F1-type ATP synthase assembly protein I
MRKVLFAIFASLFMGFVGLIVGVLVDEVFGGVNFEFTPYISIVFVIITMGAFILHSIEKSEKCG